MTLLRYKRGITESIPATTIQPPANPLELTSAMIFAGMFVLISLASTWVQREIGQSGIYALAAFVGIGDVDPFVLNLAEGGVATMPIASAAGAVLIASSSNNLLKAIYTGAFAGWRQSTMPILALSLLAALGLGVALWITQGSV